MSTELVSRAQMQVVAVAGYEPLENGLRHAHGQARPFTVMPLLPIISRSCVARGQYVVTAGSRLAFPLGSLFPALLLLLIVKMFL